MRPASRFSILALLIHVILLVRLAGNLKAGYDSMASPPPLSSNALGLELLESMWIEFTITTFVIAARLYTRVFLVRKVSWDDFLMITALVSVHHLDRSGELTEDISS